MEASHCIILHHWQAAQLSGGRRRAELLRCLALTAWSMAATPDEDCKPVFRLPRLNRGGGADQAAQVRRPRIE